VLDLGCGLGGFLPSLQQLGFETIAADMDRDSLRYCHDRGFLQCSEIDCYQLPFPDCSFDWVTMFDVIEHIEDDTRVLREVKRILKPGGKAMISVPAYPFLYANNDRIAQHYRRYTRKAVDTLFKSTGYTVDRNTHSNVLLAPLIIPTILALKSFESLFLRENPTEHTNLSLKLPDFLNDMLYRVFAAELPLSRKFNLPFGHSICAIGST
jgi:SAM-dependent methyltransferase